MTSGRVRRALLWVAVSLSVLLAVYALLGFYLVPRLVRSAASDFVQQHYHRQLVLGEVRCNPFGLRLDIRQLALPDANGRPMLGFGFLSVNLTVASLWHFAPDFEAILLEQPYVHVVIRPDGSLNLSELALPRSQPAAAPASKPARLFINRLAIREGSLALEDHAHPSEFTAEIKPVTFELRNFTTAGAGRGAYALSGLSEAGERFAWSGSLQTSPLASHGQFEIDKLQAATIWSYIRDSVGFELPRGLLTLHGEYDFSAAVAPLKLMVDVHDLSLSDLAVRPKGSKDDYIHFSSLQISDTHTDLARRTVNVGRVRLHGGEVRAWLDPAGHVNLQDLLGTRSSAVAGEPAQGHAAQNEPPAATTSKVDGAAVAWTVSVPDVALEAVKVAVEDRMVEPAAVLQLDELQAQVSGFSTTGSEPVAVRLAGKVNGTGKLDVDARLSSALSALQGQIRLAGFDLTALQPFVSAETALSLTSGLLSTRLDLERNRDGKLSATGEAEIMRLRTVDTALKQDFVKCERLQIRGISYESAPATLHIHSVLAHAPYARVIIESDRTISVKKVLKTKDAGQPLGSDSEETLGKSEAAATATSQGGKRMSVTIDSINIVDGSANYTDFWIQPHFAVGIQTLKGSITGLTSSPQSRAKIDLQGAVDRYAPAHIWGVSNPLAAAGYTDLHLSFKGVELTSATPYSGRFAGYKIEKGKLTVDINYKIRNRQLTASHHMVIEQLELGERVDSPDAVHLPVKLAVALLKDRNGVIDLNLPVSGSLDDPEFSLAPLIWKAVVGLLAKVATAPFAALGRMFGGGEQLNYIDFAPGDATLDAAAQDKLRSLTQALQAKDKLQLDVPIAYSAQLDGPALATAHLEEQLRALEQKGRANGNAPSSSSPPDPQARFQLLLRAYRTARGKDAALPAAAQAMASPSKKGTAPPDLAAANAALQSELLADVSVPDTALQQLGKERAQAIQQALVQGQIAAERVFIIGSAPHPPAEAERVRVELALK